MKLSLLDLIVFFVLTFGNIILGASFYFKNKTSDQFTSGGGKLPAWIVGMSIFATFVSSISYLALPRKAYMSNWNALVFSFSIPVASFLAYKFLFPFIVVLEVFRHTNILKIVLGFGQGFMLQHVIF